MELVLNTFGTSLNRDNEAFVVSNKKDVSVCLSTALRQFR